jgi:cell division cycle protein 37
MILALMTTVADEVKQKKGGEIKDPTERSQALEAALKDHRRQLQERTEQCKKDIQKEEAEQKKHITSDDIREGFSAGHVSKNAASAQIVDPIKPAPKTKTVKGKAKEIEVLNPKSSASQADAIPQASGYAPDGEGSGTAQIRELRDNDDEEDEEDEEIPTFSPSAKRFTQLEIGNWEASFKAISTEPALLKEDVNDAILLEAFEAAIRGDKKYAKACVHQSLVLQYCRKLGRDGVALFFKR